MEGNKVIQSKYHDSATEDTVTIQYHYDELGQLFGLRYNEVDYIYQRDIFGSIMGIIDLEGKVFVSYTYNGFGEPSIDVQTEGMTLNDLVVASKLKDHNIYIYRGYIYDQDTKMYYLDSRYYHPSIGRFITPDDPSYLSIEHINGLNLYAYCGNKKEDKMILGISKKNQNFELQILGIINQYKYVAKTGLKVKTLKQSLFSGNYKRIFGFERRISTGWDTSPSMPSSAFGRIGYSSYVTSTDGLSGAIYAFSSVTKDYMNWLGVTYSFGIGLDILGILNAEIQLHAIGIGIQMNIGAFTMGMDINLIGGTSMMIGLNKDLGNGVTRTDGVTIGLNTGALIAIIIWVYKLITTGDSNPIPGLIPA